MFAKPQIKSEARFASLSYNSELDRMHIVKSGCESETALLNQGNRNDLMWNQFVASLHKNSSKAKLSVCDIFLSVSKYFLMPTTQ